MYVVGCFLFSLFVLLWVGKGVYVIPCVRINIIFLLLMFYALVIVGVLGNLKGFKYFNISFNVCVRSIFLALAVYLLSLFLPTSFYIRLSKVTKGVRSM